MLEPRDRVLLFEALHPPEGFRFDQGFGTTYTLDLLALLMAPLAFTWFEQGDEDRRSAVNSLEILESLRRHADRMTIFCHAGRIALPKTAYPQLAFVEDSIVECQPAKGGAFHPKVWVLRWVNDAGDVRYRVLCLSRNLTFSRAWDTLLSLDGPLLPRRRAAIGRNRGLVDFVRALPGLATRKPVSAPITQRIDMLAAELERVEFELPDGMSDLRFWPLGIGARDRDPLAEAGDRLLVVSPFITLGRLEALAKGRRDVILVSTSSALAQLTRAPQGIKKFYSLAERAMLESDTEREGARESDAEAIELSDLHAKVYVSERGWDAHIWTGSANATSAAFGGNVEFLVELTGPRKRFGIDALMEPQKGEVRFVNLLTDAGEFVAKEPTDSAIEALEQRLEEIRESIASTPLEAVIRQMPAGGFDVELACRGAAPASIASDITARCWPVTMPSTAGTAFEALKPNTAVATFPGVSFQAITSFFAFELTGRASGEERQVRFVVNVPLVGAPEGRREQVLRSLVGDRSRMMRFLWLLLADEGIAVPEAQTSGQSEGETGNGASSLLGSGLFEMLLRNLDRAPERLDNLHGLLKELRHDANGKDLLPEGFDAVWEPIWRQRERRRPRSEA